MARNTSLQALWYLLNLSLLDCIFLFWWLWRICFTWTTICFLRKTLHWGPFKLPRVILFPVSHSRGKPSFSVGITNTFLLGIFTEKFATFLYVSVFHWWTLIPCTESQASPQMFSFEISSILSDVSVEVYLLLSRSLTAGYRAGSIWIHLGPFLFCF